jgi:hypothetical protein
MSMAEVSAALCSAPNIKSIYLVTTLSALVKMNSSGAQRRGEAPQQLKLALQTACLRQMPLLPFKHSYLITG